MQFEFSIPALYWLHTLRTGGLGFFRYQSSPKIVFVTKANINEGNLLDALKYFTQKMQQNIKIFIWVLEK